MVDDHAEKFGRLSPESCLSDRMPTTVNESLERDIPAFRTDRQFVYRKSTGAAF
jgi:hypothetical protein